MSSVLLFPPVHSSKLTFALKAAKDFLVNLSRTLPSILACSLFI